MIPLAAYTAVSAVLFMTGLLGVLVRRNFIIVLMSVEIMMNAANINLVAFSHYLESMAGQLVALFIIAIAAGEAAVGLAIIIVVFRGKISTNVDEMNLLKWQQDVGNHIQRCSRWLVPLNVPTSVRFRFRLRAAWLAS